MAGWGLEVFKYWNNYFWVPLIIPHFGCIVGAWAYEFYAGFHFPYWIINREKGTAELFRSNPKKGDDRGKSILMLSSENYVRHESVDCLIMSVYLNLFYIYKTNDLRVFMLSILCQIVII